MPIDDRSFGRLSRKLALFVTFLGGPMISSTLMNHCGAHQVNSVELAIVVSKKHTRFGQER